MTREIKDRIQQHIGVIGRLIADTEYHFRNLQYLTELSYEEQKVLNRYMVLRNYRSILWYLIVLDLNKLLSDKNEKFNLRKLMNLTRDNKNKQFWMHPIDLLQLHSYEASCLALKEQICKLTEIRDKHVAHFDNIDVHFTISLSELEELITFCKTVFNSINYWLSETTTQWAFPEMNMINPVIFNLSNYIKIKDLFFENHSANNSNIQMSELSKIIRPQAKL